MSRKFWTAEENELLRRIYPRELTCDVARTLGRSIPSVRGQVRKLEIRKSPEWIASLLQIEAYRLKTVGAPHRFKKGIVPANKGLRRPGYAIGRGRMHETQFKKGNHPHTWMPIGSHRFSKEGYFLRKLTDTGYPPRDWKAVHIILWEETNGPVPPSHAVTFRDGNKRNITLENLECIHRAELLRRNRLKLPEELKEVIGLKQRINRKITMAKRRSDEQKAKRFARASV